VVVAKKQAGNSHFRLDFARPTSLGLGANHPKPRLMDQALNDFSKLSFPVLLVVLIPKVKVVSFSTRSLHTSRCLHLSPIEVLFKNLVRELV
jgi:hypothetical protein